MMRKKIPLPLSTRIILLILGLLSLLFAILILGRTSISKIEWANFSSFLGREPTTTPSSLSLSEVTQIAPTFAPGVPYLTAGTLVEIRSRPGVDSPVAAILEQGAVAEVVGVSEDGAWWAIRVPYLENGKGWVPAERVVAQNTSGVDVLGDEGAVIEQVTKTPAIAQAIADVNIRSGPGMDFDKVGMLKNGTSAEILGADPQNLWWFISVIDVEGLEGWVAIDYVIARDAEDVPIIDPAAERLARIPPTPAAGAPSLVALANVNFRSGPGKNFGILGTLEQDQRVEVVGKNSDATWWAINTLRRRMASPG